MALDGLKTVWTQLWTCKLIGTEVGAKVKVAGSSSIYNTIPRYEQENYHGK